MANTTQKKATRLLELNLTPVLLGNQGDGLKRPMLKEWQTAVVDVADVADWPAGHNVGIRGGLQPDGRYLVVFDFDHHAAEIFPKWRKQAEDILNRPLVIVSSGKGYHAYFYTETETPGAKLAMGADNETLIETIGTKRQVVSAGSQHPNGKRYQFVSDATYSNIPTVTDLEYRQLTQAAAAWDKRPQRQKAKVTTTSTTHAAAGTGELADVADCLAYATRFISSETKKERNGDIRILGQGGLLITENGHKWYSFADNQGGGLADMVAWHKKITLSAAHAMLRPESNFSIYPGEHALTITLHEGQFLGDVQITLPARALLKANTGIGKTSYATSLTGPVLLVVPTQAILEQQHFRLPGSQVCYQHADTVTPGGGRLILTTPDSLPKVLKKIDAHNYALVVDEAHNIALAGYRKRAYDNVVNVLTGQWRQVILMTGTPLPLVTANLEIFESVGVQSPTRTQPAHRVTYPKGEKLQAIIDLVVSSLAGGVDHVTVFLNDKNDWLPRLQFLVKRHAKLTNKHHDQINIVNADTKQGSVYQTMVQEEIIPAHVCVTFATSVIAEGFNLRLEPIITPSGETIKRKNTIIFASAVASVEAQQVANRFRDAAAHKIYWLNNGEGKAAFFDYQKVAKSMLDRAAAVAVMANLEGDDPLVRADIRALNKLTTAQLIEREQDEYCDGVLIDRGEWRPSPVGVNHAAFSMMKAEETRNPEIFKRATAAYGWKWLPDIHMQGESSKDDKEDARRFADELAEETAVWVGHLAEGIRAEGQTVLLEKITKSGQSSDYYQVGRTVASVWGLTSDFETACNLAPLAGLSTRKQNTLKRRVTIQVERHETPLIQAVYATFDTGGRYTSEEIQEGLTRIFASRGVACLLLADIDGRQVMTPRKAVSMLRDYFHIKRCKVANDQGERANAYEISADRPEVGGMVLPVLSAPAVPVSLLQPTIKENSETPPPPPQKQAAATLDLSAQLANILPFGGEQHPFRR